MRRPVKILFSETVPLRDAIYRRLLCLDFEGRVITAGPPQEGGWVMLSGDAARLAKDVLAGCQKADQELGLGPEPAELLARRYLACFTLPPEVQS